MKKIIAIILTLILFVISAPAVMADEYTTYREIRIGLLYGDTKAESFNLKSPGGFNICFGEDKGYTYHYSMLEEEIKVSVAGETDYALQWNYHSAPSGQISIRPARGRIWINGKEYRGFVSLKRDRGGKITVINVIDIESYLYSVIGKEMSPSWNIEALKAQAVCARTFSIKNLGKYEKQGFDLCPTQASQVYGGVATEGAATIRAVNETMFEIIRYKGKPCEVFYFSSDGGVTESVENVWGTPFPHLKSVEDPFEKPSEATRYTWEKTFTAEEIQTILVGKGINIGQLLDVKVTETAPSGRATELTFYGSAGEHIVKREKTRTTLSLYSQKYTVEKKEDGTYLFSGGGWGHAVGMSQWGAKAMADSGYNYKQILNHYFTDVEIY